jgi:hypothetical protein
MSKKREEQKGLKEKCQRCSNTEFSISDDKYQKRYCLKCHFVWLPMTELELLYIDAREEIIRLKTELASLKSEKVEIFK